MPITGNYKKIQKDSAKIDRASSKFQTVGSDGILKNPQNIEAASIYYQVRKQEFWNLIYLRSDLAANV